MFALESGPPSAAVLPQTRQTKIELRVVAPRLAKRKLALPVVGVASAEIEVTAEVLNPHSPLIESYLSSFVLDLGVLHCQALMAESRPKIPSPELNVFAHHLNHEQASRFVRLHFQLDLLARTIGRTRRHFNGTLTNHAFSFVQKHKPYRVLIGVIGPGTSHSAPEDYLCLARLVLVCQLPCLLIQLVRGHSNEA